MGSNPKPRLFLHSPIFRHPLSLSLVVACMTSLACRSDQVAPTQPAPVKATVPSLLAPGEPKSVFVAPSAGKRTNATESGKPDAAVQVMNSLQQIPKDSIKSWRKSLDLIARVSRRGEKSVEMRRLILDALDAKSEIEYRSIMKALRAKISKSGKVAAAPSSAADASWTSPAVHATKLGGFAYAMNLSRSSKAKFGYASTADLGGRAALFTGSLSQADAMDDCSTTWDNVEYVGECATSEDTADAMAVLNGLESEINGDWAEATSLCGNRDPGNCEFEASDEEDEEVTSTIAGGAHTSLVMLASNSLEARPPYAVSLESAYTTSCSARFLVSEESGGALLVENCWDKGVAAAVAVTGIRTLLQEAKGRVMPAGASKLGELAVRAGMVVAAFGIGWGIGTYINCLWDNS